MSKNLEVVKPEAGAVEIHRESSKVASMLEAVIKGGVTAENVNAMEKLVGLYERMQEKDAKSAFARAFSKLQAEMPPVQAMKPVPNRDGSTRYKYAPYEEILKQIKPYLDKHGFSIRFSQKIPDEKRITMICTLMHVDGHSESNDFTCRVGQGPPSSNESQADGSASSYAQRGALCDCLNIQVRQDDDGRAEGGSDVITQEQADELEHRLKMVNGNVVDFLGLAGTKTFAEIQASKYDILDELLKRKEKKQ